jgi:hypothetical protein
MFISLTVYIALIYPPIRSPTIIQQVRCKNREKTKNRVFAVHKDRISRTPVGFPDVSAPITSKCLIKIAARHDPQFVTQAGSTQKILIYRSSTM